MSNITSNTLAAANVVGIKNQQFAPSTQVVPRKRVIIGTGDPITEAGNDLNTPIQILSAEHAGSLTGKGFMLHRLAMWTFKGSTVPTYIIQQAEAGAGVQAVGEIDFAGSTGVLAGTLALYINAVRVPVAIPAAATVENICDLCVAAINGNDDLPITAAKHAVTFELDITAKSKGTWGNRITIGLNLLSSDVMPTGIAAAITAMSTGAGIPDIQDALDSLGIGDSANELQFTAIIHGYGQDATTLTAISTYNGIGNDFVGCYDKIVHRPMRSLIGDTATGAAGLAALVVIGGNNKQDRTTGIIAAPNSPNMPDEIAALTIGLIEKVANDRPERNYLNILLPEVLPGDKVDRWTDIHDNSDIAVKAGISTTLVKSGAVYLQNVITMYHPDDVSQNSNAYREMRNIAILQNIAYNWWLNFEGEKWKGKTIVSDTNRVSDINARLYVVDMDTYREDAVALILLFEKNAWIYEAAFSIEELKQPGSIAIRTGNDGFEANIKLILSGVLNIIDNRIFVDTSIATLL
jgi:phage tail sheath gpL-like